MLANPAHAVTKELALRLPSEESTTTVSDEQLREQCMLLIQALTTTTVPTGVSTKNCTPIKSSAKSGRISVVSGSSKNTHATLAQMIAAYGGIVSPGSVVAGTSKIFFDSLAHTLLESCLSECMQLCYNKIGKSILRYMRKKRARKVLAATKTLLRVARGMLARRRVIRIATIQEIQEKKQEAAVADKDAYPRAIAQFKCQDAMIQEEINKIVTAKRTADEIASMRLDFAAEKATLIEYATHFLPSSVLQQKILESSELIKDGYLLLRAEKLIPLTTFGKAFSIGRHVKPEHRLTSVKYANKIVAKDHALFKNINKLMERLKELFELAKLEQEQLQEARKKQQHHVGQQDGVEHTAELDRKLAAVNRVSAKTRTIYQYYTHYVSQVRNDGPLH